MVCETPTEECTVKVNPFRRSLWLDYPVCMRLYTRLGFYIRKDGKGLYRRFRSLYLLNSLTIPEKKKKTVLYTTYGRGVVNLMTY